MNSIDSLQSSHMPSGFVVSFTPQILKNYEKNAKLGRFVVFIVGDEEVEKKVREPIKGTAKNDYRIYNLSEKYSIRG